MRNKNTDKGELLHSAVWRLYQKGRQHHEAQNIYKDTQRYHCFYEGDQWRGFDGGDEMPRLNFIKPIGRYKVSSIAQNQVQMIFSPIGDKTKSSIALCKELTSLAERQWEEGSMESLSWEIIKNAFITGESYIYNSVQAQGLSGLGAWKPSIKQKLIGREAIYFADEENPELHEQEYIIISERVSIAAIKKEARKNGLDSSLIDTIVPDNEDMGNFFENEEKCSSILFMKKTEEGIAFCRSTETVIYQPEKLIKGIFRYPIAQMKWESRAGSIRGIGGVSNLIPNQLEVNKTAARRAVAVKRFSFPTLAYDRSAVSNVEELSKIGSCIALDNARDNPIDRIVQYLNPALISPDAQALQSELLQLSRELEGAGDAATGQVDPTRASGEAIKAARDQASIPLNEQVAAYRHFVEDMAKIWLSLWLAYATNGLFVSGGNSVNNVRSNSRIVSPRASADTPAHRVIPRKELAELQKNLPCIKIDVSPVDPYSRLSQEIALERLFSRGDISFEEYVGALDDTSGVPKAKLSAIIEARGKV